MKYFVREILETEKCTYCLCRLILAVCAMIVSYLGTNYAREKREHLQMWKRWVQNENVGKGWLWTINTQMAKFFRSIALCGNVLFCQYHLLQSWGSHSSCNVSVPAVHENRATEHLQTIRATPCSAEQTSVLGGVPAVQQGQDMGPAALGFIRKGKGLWTPTVCFSMVLSADQKSWWLAKAGWIGEVWRSCPVWDQEELPVFLSHVWALLQGFFCLKLCLEKSDGECFKVTIVSAL